MDYSQLSDFEINKRVCEALDMEEHFFIPNDEADFDSEIPTDERGPIWQTQKRILMASVLQTEIASILAIILNTHGRLSLKTTSA